MELEPELVQEFAKLRVSTREISAEELANFDASAPLQSRAHVPHPSYEHVPQFFSVPPHPADRLRCLLRREAQLLHLHQQVGELMCSEECNDLWRQLKEHVTETTPKNQKLISYHDYCRLRAAVEPKHRKYLTVRLFAHLLSESPHLGSVEIGFMFDYMMAKVWQAQCRIGLAFYDEVGQGYLREFELENYISDLIPNMVQIRDIMQPDFKKFYVCTLVKRVFFFLDHLNTGRIRISDLLASGMIDNLMELREEAKPIQSKADLEEFNPFAMNTVLAVYSSYINLDLDRNGLLSKKELAAYGSGSLTPLFLDRVFEECHTYCGEMDFKTFLSFDLALENRQTSSSLHYLFRMLDIDHCGYLTMRTLRYFFKSIDEQLKADNSNVVRFEDFSNEIFDMVNPKDPCKITLKDVINCGQAETVVSILIEFQKFLAYENREIILPQKQKCPPHATRRRQAN